MWTSALAMPHSQVTVQDMLLKLSQQFPGQFGSLSMAQLGVMFQIPNMAAAFQSTIDPQLALAQWENSRIMAGADDFEVEIAPWHNHDIHVQEHNRERASSAYRDAPQPHRDFMDVHIQAHTQLAAEQMLKQQEQAGVFEGGAAPMPMDPMAGGPPGPGGPPPGGPPGAGAGPPGAPPPMPPNIHVQMPSQQPPVVNMAAPIVHVHPEIHVPAAAANEPQAMKVVRDSKGQITGVVKV